ncbi:Serine-threonine protein kinase 19 [Metschnikowia aff. pulcherrima]|uniref:Serine-threonine protein kinase 19 n=1 Tax=Metschnikowia aff. pulcherrima TaxID=2163413 RepID=A0A4P6XMS4_9ASCO|nr:Serine-threonine protein kinase 19 [Metschnikowia aff. pulcherrima]
MSLQSTGAQLSRISKPGKKLFSNPLERKSVNRKGSSPKKKSVGVQPSKDERLDVLEHNIHMDFELRDSSSIVSVMDQVLQNQWSESTLYHNRFYSLEAKTKCKSPSDLLFLLRGLSMEVKASIISYRNLQLPPGGMLTVNQLYTLFESRGNTFVDRSLELCTRNDQVRKFVITNALPVISRTGKGGLFNQVAYGYENAEVVVKTDQYLREISHFMDLSDFDSLQAATKLESFIRESPTAVSVTNQNFSKPELTILVNAGFLTLTSNHHYEIDTHHYSIAYPRCGTFLKMINSGRAWLVKTLNKASHRELLEEKMFEKWEGKVMANFRKPFYGYDLLWILADAKGAGLVEAFDTPVGRGWRLTGKL